MKVNEILVSLIDEKAEREYLTLSDQSEIEKIFANRFEGGTVFTVDEEVFAINEVTVGISTDGNIGTLTINLFTEKLGHVDDMD